MKLSERSIMIVHYMCTIEQWVLLFGTVWLVGWKDWSPWWFGLTLFLLAGSAPSVVILALESGKP